MSPPAPSAQLEEVKRELLDARERAHRLCDAVSPAIWAARPAADRWSIGECVIHLNTTSERYLPLIDDAMRDGPAAGPAREDPFRTGWLAGLLLWTLEPPYRFRFKTPAAFVPATVEPRDTVLARFDDRQGDLLARVDAAQGLPLERLMVVSPFNARVEYNLYATFLVLAAHQRRHLWQAEQVYARVAAGGTKDRRPTAGPAP